MNSMRHSVFGAILCVVGSAYHVTPVTRRDGTSRVPLPHGSAVSPAPLPPLRAAVIVPGFLSAASDFEDLASALTAEGLPTTVVPMTVLDWLPMIGGRSVRPLLARIDHTVRHVAAGIENVPRFDYNLLDLLQDFRHNPGGVFKVGGSDQPDDYPPITPRGTFPPAPQPVGRVGLIGHSAGGFIARVYLSDRSYGGRAHGGAALVHSLVTLGTPHAEGAGVPFENVRWVNREGAPRGVRCLAVGAIGTPGTGSGALTTGAYSFCTPEGVGGEVLDGDGVTTAGSALALAALRGSGEVETLELEGVTHYPWTAPGPVADLVAPELTAAYRAGRPWYGSDGPRQLWARWLLEQGKA